MKYCKEPTEIPLNLIRCESFRPLTEVGKGIIRKSIESTKGSESDGLIRTRYLVLMKLESPDENGCMYECIDGNHRLSVFKEMKVPNWLCYVTPSTITQQEYHLLAFGKFFFSH